MHLRLLDLLVCPIDKTPLELVEWESSLVSLAVEDVRRAERLGLDPALFAKEIMTGVLLNRARKIAYPIYRGIPRLLVFPTGIAREFARTHVDRITRELPDFRIPHDCAMPGEETVLRTFSSEWVNYDWDGQSYWNLTPDLLYHSMHFLLNLDCRPMQGQLVLEVGIGIGGIADYMARCEGCELVGIDLSYAVDPAYKHFSKNRFFHIVQASAFAPPFRESTFDFVYSQGVLHHTFSTKAAFDQICKLPKLGRRLYVWVYSHYDEQRTFTRRALMRIERLIRPWCWRLPEGLQTMVLLPAVPFYFIHQQMHVQQKGVGYIRYGWREALHAARDRFTPRYVYRHSEEEVCKWFHEAGYTELLPISTRDHPDFVPPSLVYATAVEGIRC